MEGVSACRVGKGLGGGLTPLLRMVLSLSGQIRHYDMLNRVGIDVIRIYHTPSGKHIHCV